jgi:UDP-N-acetylmuramoyl-L-alanyl-D-glutamate--2,6-diaminopimelate ligase
MKKLIPQSLKNIYHLFQAVLANVVFGFPSRKMKVIGVTGTNGKTTTVQMIAKIFEEAGSRVAVASTINFKVAEKEWVNATKFTTLSSWKLQKHLRQAVKASCDYAVIEVTSHALDQSRVWGVDFLVAAITNITREHLDYHQTMEEYAEAKEKLFMLIAGKINSASVVNLNMEFSENFLKYKTDKNYGYFLESQNPNSRPEQDVEILIARNIKKTITGSEFVVEDAMFKLSLPGDFNIENALAAVCVGRSQNIPLEKISAALAKIKSIPGRMERIENDRGIEIIVDYAVTPDSLEKLYQLIDEIHSQPHPDPDPLLIKEREKKIIAVFGSCGERDRGKRPIMGEIVAKYADYCIVTNEDPYNEDPQQIIEEVFGGVLKYKKENENAWRILDRKEAIKKALQIAKPGDIVVVTGKGAEETMAVGEKMITWNDPKVIREVLQESR